EIVLGTRDTNLASKIITRDFQSPRHGQQVLDEPSKPSVRLSLQECGKRNRRRHTMARLGYFLPLRTPRRYGNGLHWALLFSYRPVAADPKSACGCVVGRHST